MRTRSGVQPLGFEIWMVFVFPGRNPDTDTKYPEKRISQLCLHRQKPAAKGAGSAYLSRDRHLCCDRRAAVNADQRISAVRTVRVGEDKVCVDVVDR